MLILNDLKQKNPISQAMLLLLSGASSRPDDEPPGRHHNWHHCGQTPRLPRHSAVLRFVKLTAFCLSNRGLF